MCQMCSHWTRDISPCALSLRAVSRSLHVTRGIFLPKHFMPNLSPSSLHYIDSVSHEHAIRQYLVHDHVWMVSMHMTICV